VQRSKGRKLFLFALWARVKRNRIPAYPKRFQDGNLMTTKGRKRAEAFEGRRKYT
jgi:hypothetical protein